MAKCQEMKTRNRKASAALLSPEQLTAAARIGIDPRRLAWVLQCPHGGHATPGSRSYNRKTQ
jgi:hypothetical protein